MSRNSSKTSLKGGREGHREMGRLEGAAEVVGRGVKFHVLGFNMKENREKKGCQMRIKFLVYLNRLGAGAGAGAGAGVNLW